MEKKPPTANSEEAARPLKKIGNYDVLLEEVGAAASAGTELEGIKTLRLLSCPHVGNNRLEVLLLMNRNEYEERLNAGFDTSPILDKLVDIVTQQCVPPGRFLLSSTQDDSAGKEDSSKNINDRSYEEYDWQEVEIEQARQFLNAALLDGSTAGLVGFPTTKNHNFVQQHQSPPTFAAKDTVSNRAAENKKRFRRSSLLRRSVSESFVRKVQSEGGNTTNSGGGGFRGAFRASEFGKKKAPNRRHSSFMIGKNRKEKPAPKVEQAEDLDILFNFEQTSLLPNHVGNNRLRVLLNIHKERYEKSDENDQMSSLQEWVRTVTQFWGGRFLRQEEEDAKTYEVLDANQAELALHSVISELSTSGGDDIASITSSSGKKALPVDSVVAPTMNVQHMRSAAVESLQKRKKRQGLASRLRRLASNALTRGVSTPTTSGPDMVAGTGSLESFPKHRSMPDFARDDSNSLPFTTDQSVPEFSGRHYNSNATATVSAANSSGITSLPTSPIPMMQGGDVAANQRAGRRSFSMSLPRFMKSRASLRRNQNLAADGVSQDLRASLEADDREFGPEIFGESSPDVDANGL
jgi:hypothetical protein